MKKSYLQQKRRRSITETLGERRKQSLKKYAKSFEAKSKVKKKEMLKEAILLDNTNANLNYDYLSLIKNNKNEFNQVETLMYTLPKEKVSEFKSSKQFIQDWKKECEQLVQHISNSANFKSDTDLENWLETTQLKNLFIPNQPITLLLNSNLYYRRWIDSIHFYRKGVSIKYGPQIRQYPLFLSKELKKENEDHEVVNYLLDLLTVNASTPTSTFMILTSKRSINKELKKLLKNENCKCSLKKNTLTIQRHSDQLILDLNKHSLDLFVEYFRDKLFKTDYQYYYSTLRESAKNHYFTTDLQFFRDLISNILQSNAIISNYYANSYYQEKYPFAKNKFIDEIWSHVYFFPFHNLDIHGITDSNNLNIYLNNLPRTPKFCYDKNYHVKNSIVKLLNLGGIILTILHEILGHYLKRYLNMELNTNYNSPDESSSVGEGGFYFEETLFGERISKISLLTSLFLMNEKYWKFNFEKFQETYKKFKTMNKSQQLLQIKEECKQRHIKAVLKQYEISIDKITEEQLQYLVLSMHCSSNSSGFITMEMGGCGYGLSRIYEIVNP